MTARTRIAAVVAATALVLALALFATRPAANRPSAFSPGPAGWLAARKYLEASGRRVRLLDVALSEEKAGLDAALIMAFPASKAMGDADLAALRARVSRGGLAVVAYSGRPPGFAENRLLDFLDLSARDVRGDPPLSPWRWRAWVSETRSLRPDPSLGAGVAPVVISAPRWMPVAPEGARTLWRGEEDAPAIFEVRSGRGRLLVLPADALSNGRLLERGNGDLLETVASAAGGELLLDEHAHGLLSPGASRPGPGRAAFDVLIAQLAILYALLLWALGRRFGPAWHEGVVASGSTAAFLRRLAARHKKLGHAPEAARRLIERVAELDPRMRIGSAARLAADRADDEGLLALARALSRTGKEKEAT